MKLIWVQGLTMVATLYVINTQIKAHTWMDLYDNLENCIVCSGLWDYKLICNERKMYMYEFLLLLINFSIYT